jgi:hypothetical protein
MSKAALATLVALMMHSIASVAAPAGSDEASMGQLLH